MQVQEKVALSGDGGDELFGGYKRHIFGKKIWDFNNFLPSNLSQNLIKILERNSLVKSLLGTNKFDYYLQIFNKSLSSDTSNQFYDKLRSVWCDPSEIINKNINIPTNFTSKNKNLTEDMMYWDLTDYLSEGIMTKVDRASMSNSLEVKLS